VQRHPDLAEERIGLGNGEAAQHAANDRAAAAQKSASLTCAL